MSKGSMVKFLDSYQMTKIDLNIDGDSIFVQ